MTVWILSTCALIAALILLRLLFKGRMDPRLTYALWLAAALRILIPVTLFPSPLSVDTLVQRTDMAILPKIALYVFTPKKYVTVAKPEGVDINDCARDLEAQGVFIYDYSTTYDAQTWKGQPDYLPSAALAPEGYEKGTGQIVRFIVKDFSVWHRVYLAGSLAVFAVLLGTNVRFEDTLRKKRRPYEEPLPVPCPLQVWVVEDLPSPCLFGFSRPSIYVNQAALDSGRLDHVLTHELTHYRRHDHWWAALRCACLCVQWANPLVWAAASLSRQDCEAACDADAIQSLGEDQRIPYGKTLVSMVSAGRPSSALLHTATTMTGGKKDLFRRVSLIAKKPHMTVLTVTAVALAAVLAAGFTFGGAAAPQETPPGNAPEPAASSSPADGTAGPADAQALTPAQTVLAAFETIVGTGDSFTLSVGGPVPGSWKSYHRSNYRVEGLDQYQAAGMDAERMNYYRRGLTGFGWQTLEAASALPGGNVLTLRSADGETALSFWENGSIAVLAQGGTETRLLAAPPPVPDMPGMDSPYAWLLPLAEDAAMDPVWHISLPADPTDSDILAYARQAADGLMDLPDWHRAKPLDCVPDPDGCFVMETYAGSPSSVCFHLAFFLKLEDKAVSNWQEGTCGIGPLPPYSLAPVNEGPYAGWQCLSLQAAALPDGGAVSAPPRYLALYGAGARLIFPVPLGEASLDELLSYMCLTREGEHGHDFYIPEALLYRYGKDPDALNSALDALPGDQARQIVRTLGNFLDRTAPSTLIPTFEELYEGLSPKYRPYLLSDSSRLRSTIYTVGDGGPS